MGDLILCNGRVVTPWGVVDADVLVVGGRIAAVEQLAACRAEDPLSRAGARERTRGRVEPDAADREPDAAPSAPGAAVGGTREHPRGDRPGAPQRIDLDGRWLLPGFVDVHVHGGDGAQFNTADPDEVQRVARFHARHGTTALLATTVAAPVDELLDALGAIRTATAAPAPGAAEVLGAHLEGPFLSPAWPGAMEPAHFLDPDPAVLDRLLAGGGVRAMSVAPERPGALDLIARAAAAGVRISLAHTDARFDDAVAAVHAGATAVTHAFNAMRPLHHRDPGLLGAALDLDELTCEVIADGVHVDPAAVRLLQRLKGPERTMLVTDAIEATGLPDGDYRLGDRAIAVAGGRATLPGAETIAGATLTMDRALRNAVVFCDVSVADAARMAATTPAELLGIADRKGSIAPGLDADVAILDADLTLAGVLARGEWALPLAGPSDG